MELLRDLTDHVMPTARRHLDADAARGFQLLYEALRLSRYALECAGDDACDALAAQLVGRLRTELLSAHLQMPSVWPWRGAALVRPDGRIVSGSGIYDTTLRVWNASTGACELVLEGHTDAVKCVCVCCPTVLSFLAWVTATIRFVCGTQRRARACVFSRATLESPSACARCPTVASCWAYIMSRFECGML